MKQVVVFGGINSDLTAVADPLLPGTSNPGSVFMSPGGVGRNIAETLARLGVPTLLLGLAAQDASGDEALRRTAEAGVDVSRVLRGKPGERALYLAVHRQDGELALAVSDMAALDGCSESYPREQREAISRAAMLVLDANVPLAAAGAAIEVAREASVPVVIEPVSIAKARRIGSISAQVFAATPNGEEARELASGNLTVEHTLVTRGADGVLWVGPSGVERRFPVALLEEPRTNGAGDAFVAGVVAGLHSGLEMEHAIPWGLAAARITCGSEETTCGGMTRELLLKEVRLWS